MVELDYNTISLVIESWEALRRIKNYEEVAGRTLFRILFEKCPPAKVLFGFPLDINTDSPELLHSKRFIMHSAYLIQMLDTALNMLGPDAELLAEIMGELGEKHIRYGVKPDMFPVMKEGLMVTLKENLTSEYFNDATEKAWDETFDALSQDMIRAMA